MIPFALARNNVLESPKMPLFDDPESLFNRPLTMFPPEEAAWEQVRAARAAIAMNLSICFVFGIVFDVIRRLLLKE
jgi:hypothetical protein